MPAGGVGEAPGADLKWQHPLPAEDTLPRRYYARHIRTARLHRQARRRGCQATRAGRVKIMACLEKPAIIERILAHLNDKAPSAGTAMLSDGSAPPQQQELGALGGLVSSIELKNHLPTMLLRYLRRCCLASIDL